MWFTKCHIGTILTPCIKSLKNLSPQRIYLCLKRTQWVKFRGQVSFTSSPLFPTKPKRKWMLRESGFWSKGWHARPTMIMDKLKFLQLLVVIMKTRMRVDTHGWRARKMFSSSGAPLPLQKCHMDLKVTIVASCTNPPIRRDNHLWSARPTSQRVPTPYKILNIIQLSTIRRRIKRWISLVRIAWCDRNPNRSAKAFFATPDLASSYRIQVHPRSSWDMR